MGLDELGEIVRRDVGDPRWPEWSTAVADADADADPFRAVAPSASTSEVVALGTDGSVVNGSGRAKKQADS